MEVLGEVGRGHVRRVAVEEGGGALERMHATDVDAWIAASVLPVSMHSPMLTVASGP